MVPRRSVVNADRLRTWRRAATGAFLATLTACSWFTDFKQQPKVDPWDTANDTTPFHGNPQSSVDIYGSAAPGFEYAREPLPQNITAMASIPNPTPADSASISRGRVMFQINCAVCHGPLGMGNGPVSRYGLPAPSIGAGSPAAGYTDGYIFGMIRNGRGLMPTYNRIEEHDRWDIVNYLRTVQGKGPVPADTSHGLPGETGTMTPGFSTMGPTRPAPYYGNLGVMGASASSASAAPAAASRADSTKPIAAKPPAAKPPVPNAEHQP
jgi:mono/diheme cytochrome c family protein